MSFSIKTGAQAVATGARAVAKGTGVLLDFLDNASVKEMKTELKMNANLYGKPKLDNDGLYRIIKCEFTGDTRGNDWYADLVCIGIDDTMHLPLDQL